MSQNSAIVWPLSEYSTCFRGVESFDGSAVAANDLPVLLQSLGFYVESTTFDDIKDIVGNEIHCDIIFFDDLVDALMLLRDHRTEAKVLQSVESRRLRAQRALAAVIARSVGSGIIFLLEFASLVAELVVNIFILTKGIVAEDEVNAVTESAAIRITLAVEVMPFGTLHVLFEKFLNTMFRVVRVAVDTLTLNIVLDENVACSGATSLLVSK